MIKNGKQALVLGGSMGGLLAARALSDYYQQVTVVERDTFPAIGEHRRGVPQGRHTHGLLASGRRVLEHFFPGIGDELIAAGAVEDDLVGGGRWFMAGGCLGRCKSGLDGLMLSRPLLEGMVRKRLLALRNVRSMENADVSGFVMSEDGGRVNGIRYGIDQRMLTADLVVDASGRGSHTPDWLAAAGFPRPVEERVEIALGYSSCLFRRKPTDMDGDSLAIIPPTPLGKKGGVMVAQEGDRWTVTLIAHFGEYPPTDLPGFIEYSRHLPAPYIYDVIRHSEPLSAAVQARFPASVRRHYEKLSRFPEGYLVFGDAICSFNPIYGQGMSVSALQSIALSEALAEGEANLAARFFPRASKVVDIPWSIAVGNDLRMPEAVGPRNAGVTFINWYMAKLHKAAHRDPALSVAFHNVGNLLAPPPSVMAPANMWRVIKGNLFARRAAGVENFGVTGGCRT